MSGCDCCRIQKCEQRSGCDPLVAVPSREELGAILGAAPLRAFPQKSEGSAAVPGAALIMGECPSPSLCCSDHHPAHPGTSTPGWRPWSFSLSLPPSLCLSLPFCQETESEVPRVQKAIPQGLFPLYLCPRNTQKKLGDP